MLAGCQSGTAGSSNTTDLSSTTSEENAKPYDGTTLNMYVCASVWSDEVVKALPEFTEQTGISVNNQQYTDTQVRQKIAVDMAAGGKNVDIIQLAPPQDLLNYSSKSWLAPLNDFVDNAPADYDFEDFSASCIEACSVDGVLYAIPFMTEREVLMYNQKMFDDNGVTEVPTTFEELEAAAAACTQGDIAGLAMRGSGSNAVTQFSGFLYSFGGDFFDADTNTAMINSPEAIEAFEFYGKLCKEYGPMGCTNMNWQETQALFAQGQAAMRIDADSTYGYTVDPESSLVAEDVSMAPFPAGPEGSKPFNVTSWGYGISAGSQNKEAAWEFIMWATGKEHDIVATKAGNPSARDSTWENEEAITAFPEEMVETINATIPNAVPYDRPRMISVGEARTEIGNVIIAAIEGADTATITSMANSANEAVQKLLDNDANA